MFADVSAYQLFMGRYSDPLAHEFAQEAGVAAGDRVCDVGCGTGALTTLLADLAGVQNVAGVDPSEPFVEQARSRVPGADLRVGSAEALPFEDYSFDVALSQLVFHFVSDPPKAAAEMARVTRPGGRVAACVWDLSGGMTMIRAFWDAARELDPNAPDEAERFGGARGQLAGLWRDTGLDDVRETILTVSSEYTRFEELWSSFRGASGPIGVHLTSLDQSQQEALRAALHRHLGSPDGPFALTAGAWCAVGVV